METRKIVNPWAGLGAMALAMTNQNLMRAIPNYISGNFVKRNYNLPDSKGSAEYHSEYVLKNGKNSIPRHIKENFEIASK